MRDVYENTVRFAETDAQGIVFYGNYLTFQDEAFNAFMEAIGFHYDELRRRDWDVHVVNVELNYRSQAGFRDRLVHGMRIASIGESSIEFEYECRRADDERTIVDGTVTHAAVDDGGETATVPQDFREAVVEFQDEPPAPD
jgi:acyl-CoA thioester hydrolase